MASVLVTVALGLWFFHDSGYGRDTSYLFAGMLPVATMVAASAVTLIAVSLATKPPSGRTIRKFFPE